MTLDRRLHAFRPDLAEASLRGQVEAERFVEGVRAQVVVPVVALRPQPDLARGIDTELLLGEEVDVLERRDGWAWVKAVSDGYVGYLPVDAIGPFAAPTHIISSPAALVFADRSIKAPVVERLPMGARLTVTASEGAFHQVEGGFVHDRHLSPLDRTESDPVAVAARLAGVPYRWGGRSGDGIDCSGLVQLALAFAGHSAPRDSDQQQGLGRAIAEGEPLRRGDLVFLPGHVGMMADDTHLLHANAFWMRVVTEPLADVVARQPEGQGITALRRIS